MHLEGYPLAFTPKHLSEAIFNRDMSATHGPSYSLAKRALGQDITPILFCKIQLEWSIVSQMNSVLRAHFPVILPVNLVVLPVIL